MNQNHFKPTSSLRHFAIWIGTICFLAAFSMVTQPPVAHAQDCPSFPIDVSNTTELNEAIACYNTAAAGTYNITIMADFTITEATPRVNNPNGAVLDINGNGKTIDGADSFRFLTIDRSTVNIASITLQNTRHADSGRDECFSETCGGAIALFGSGNANVLDSKILNSDAFFGGGIWNRGGTLTVENSYFSGNAANDGGGIYSEREAIIKGSTFLKTGNYTTTVRSIAAGLRIYLYKKQGVTSIQLGGAPIAIAGPVKAWKEPLMSAIPTIDWPTLLEQSRV